MNSINKNYKDRLFRFIFGEEQNKEFLLSLYNALNNTEHTDVAELEITTIEDVIYMKMKNDVSCLVNSVMSIYEQQSTYNPNMPFRSFEYCAKIYNKFVASNQYDIYGSRLIKLPAPQCYVFYNGTAKHKDREILKLSEAFEKPVDGYEWTVIMLNINKGHNKELLDKCQALKEYSDLVQLIRDYKKDDKLFNAVEKAVKEIISRKGVLSKLLEEHRAEVVEVCITEYNEELHEKNLREEGRLEERARAEKEKRELLLKMLANGADKEFVLNVGFSEEEYENVLKTMK